MANKYLDLEGAQRLVSKLKTYISNAVKVTGVKGNEESSYRTGNINLTADNIGAFKKQPYAEGTLEAGIRPYIDQARANRLVFLPSDQIIIEQTTDGGETWVSAECSDSAKTNLFAENSAFIRIPLLNNAKSTNCGLRITITGMKYDVPEGTAETEKYNYWNSNYIKSTERYFNVREWWFWLSSNNDRIRPEIYCATGANPNNWLTVFNKDFRMSGWSGSDWIRAGDGKSFGGSTNQTSNNWNWRLIFWSAPIKGREFGSAAQQEILQIRCYGDSVWGAPNNLMAKDHLYSWDYNKNATFPGAVNAVSFNGNATTATTLSETLGINKGGTSATTALTGFKNLIHRGNATDANAALSIGMYYTTSSTTNLPSIAYDTWNNGCGVIVVYVSFSETHDNTNNWIWQLWFNTSSNDIYRRKKVNNANWSSWQSLSNATTVNNLTVQTAVPANAVFTDTVTTASTTGSGNAVTSIASNNGALTVTKGASFTTASEVRSMISDAISDITDYDGESF